MTNVVMICKDRPRLTEQTLRTLYDNTPFRDFNLMIVDDTEDGSLDDLLDRYCFKENCKQAAHIPTGIVGLNKNQGASLSEMVFGRGDWLCFIDNDIAFFPGWLDEMKRAVAFNAECILGGYRHPYHTPNQLLRYAVMPAGQYVRGQEYVPEYTSTIEATDAVAGYLHFMSWSTWDKFGPYDANSKGVCQSEDHAICRRVVEAGGLVGYVHPPVIANCGLTNSEGKPAIGSEAFPRIPGLIYE